MYQAPPSEQSHAFDKDKPMSMKQTATGLSTFPVFVSLHQMIKTSPLYAQQSSYQPIHTSTFVYLLHTRSQTIQTPTHLISPPYLPPLAFLFTRKSNSHDSRIETYHRTKLDLIHPHPPAGALCFSKIKHNKPHIFSIMSLPLPLSLLFLTFYIFEILVAAVFSHKFAWAEGKFSVEAGLIVLFEMC